MTGSHPLDYGERKRLGLLAAAFLAGPLAWSINQGLGYAVIKPVCADRATYVLWLIALGTFALAATGVLGGWHCLRAAGAGAVEDGGRAVDRSYFLAGLAIAFNGLIALLILTSVIPQFLLSPCE